MCMVFIIGCFVYADDVIFLSASILQLQKMQDICSNQAADIDIAFNTKKSSHFVVGKLFDCNLLSLHLGYSLKRLGEDLIDIFWALTNAIAGYKYPALFLFFL